MSWERHEEGATSWNESLLRFDAVPLYQVYEWAQHRQRFGWEPLRWVSRGSNGEIDAMVQGLYRALPLGAGLLWSYGGPIGAMQRWDAELREAIRRDTGARFLYYRIYSNREAAAPDETRLRELGWRRPRHPVRGTKTMRLSLAKPLDELRSGFTRNWKRNLKRGLKGHLTIQHWRDPDPNAMHEIYSEMESLKGLDEQFSRDELASAVETLGSKLVVYRAQDEAGNLLALRGCALMGRFAWDLFAATTRAARNLYASYGVMWELLQHCHREGVLEYDLMGIDPDRNPGVYNFKKGTGATPVEFLGEWEWATHRPVRWAVGLASRVRQIG